MSSVCFFYYRRYTCTKKFKSKTMKTCIFSQYCSFKLEKDKQPIFWKETYWMISHPPLPNMACLILQHIESLWAHSYFTIKVLHILDYCAWTLHQNVCNLKRCWKVLKVSINTLYFKTQNLTTKSLTTTFTLKSWNVKHML